MSTSSIRPSGARAPSTRSSVPRHSLRLRLATQAGQGLLDGAWWPQSRDLEVELPDLLRHLPRGLGTMSRVLCSAPDWDVSPARVQVDGGYVVVDNVARTDLHLIVLRSVTRSGLTLLVVPSAFSHEQGSEAMLAALTHRNAHAAHALLREVTDQPPHDAGRRWT